MAMQWTVTLTAGDGDQARAEADLRRRLKMAGRRFNIRCAAIGDVRLVPGSVRPVAPLASDRRARWQSAG